MRADITKPIREPLIPACGGRDGHDVTVFEEGAKRGPTTTGSLPSTLIDVGSALVLPRICPGRNQIARGVQVPFWHHVRQHPRRDAVHLCVRRARESTRRFKRPPNRCRATSSRHREGRAAARTRTGVPTRAASRARKWDDLRGDGRGEVGPRWGPSGADSKV